MIAENFLGTQDELKVHIVVLASGGGCDRAGEERTCDDHAALIDALSIMAIDRRIASISVSIEQECFPVLAAMMWNRVCSARLRVVPTRAGSLASVKAAVAGLAGPVLVTGTSAMNGAYRSLGDLLGALGTEEKARIIPYPASGSARGAAGGAGAYLVSSPDLVDLAERTMRPTPGRGPDLVRRIVAWLAQAAARGAT